MRSSRIWAILLITFSTFSYAQSNCPDPGGCSIVSFAAYQNTAGVLKIGNTTGKVYSKKKRIVCTGSNCNQLFTIATALVAPLTSSASPGSRVSRVDVDQVQVLIEARFITTTTSFLRDIGLTDFGKGLPLQDVDSQSNLNSGYPNLKGAGENGVMHVAPGPGEQHKIVHQLLEAEQNKLLQPSFLRSSAKGLVNATVDRDLTLQVFVEQTDNANVKLVIQPIKNNRKKDGTANIFPIGPTDSQSKTETIPSAAVTPVLSDIPILGHLFGHKKIRNKNNREELAIFIAPVIISDGLKTTSAVTLGPALQLTNFKATTNPGPEFFQSLAIDPLGRFLVYSEYSPTCRKSILKYMKLDPAAVMQGGSFAGKPKVLAGCGFFKTSPTGAYGLDLINID